MPIPSPKPALLATEVPSAKSLPDTQLEQDKIDVKKWFDETAAKIQPMIPNDKWDYVQQSMAELVTSGAQRTDSRLMDMACQLLREFVVQPYYIDSEGADQAIGNQAKNIALAIHEAIKYIPRPEEPDVRNNWLEAYRASLYRCPSPPYS